LRSRTRSDTAPVSGVAILAGGEATRLPGKLLLDAGGLPLVVRAYRNVGIGRETFVSSASSFPPGVDAMLPVPVVVDRRPRRGPLGGLLTTLGQMRSRWVFVVAGDAPLAGRLLLERLEAARRPGDEAVVPVREVDGRAQLEPLAGLYDRAAFLCAGAATLRAGRGSVRAVVERLRARHVAVDDPLIFTNINTPADYAAFRGEAQEPAAGMQDCAPREGGANGEPQESAAERGVNRKLSANGEPQESAAERGVNRKLSANGEPQESAAERGVNRKLSANGEPQESAAGGSGGRVPPFKGKRSA
jgi:molybdopterin-guanine dinucleotide biosynthesis protein A